MHTQRNKSKKKNQLQADHDKESKNLDDLFYNLGLEDETWLRIVRALAARGFPVKDEDLQIGKQ